MKGFTKNKWTVLLLFGLIGQIAWAVENMYFNLFVFDTIAPDLSAVTLMVQLSGIMATVTTLVAGTLCDKTGNRRSFISWGYVIWGITVIMFGSISPSLIERVFSVESRRAIAIALVLVVVGDCVMTFFGSTANDAAFNTWVTDNTESAYRGKIESVLSILPLVAMLIVAGGFGILVNAIGYFGVFTALGIVISVCGIVGIFLIKDADTLEKSGTLKDIFYGFKPSVIKNNKSLYVTLCIMGVYGIACQIFMPYLIIYMKTYLGFNELEYSVIFALAILLGGALNVYLGVLADKKDKTKLMYVAVVLFAVGLLGMYLSKNMDKTLLFILFFVSAFLMISGNIFLSALCGASVRDNTPSESAGKLQGVRMIFSVLLPMLFGPMIGNAINKTANIPLPDVNSADIMTTAYIPAPEIFLVGAIFSLVILAIIPLLRKLAKKEN